MKNEEEKYKLGYRRLVAALKNIFPLSSRPGSSPIQPSPTQPVLKEKRKTPPSSPQSSLP
ncbi:hypothetical protein EX30DRAFT_341766 [Ascodesmis nigricans]|uniref:Uncharacterized protein n=1 Tax=Ascodesmis nigricans TaxID=341454 RepID=A0A4S2MUF6_9PEZI|nr:hypothetical protein EX30DRAFT_341766 [Ascodesmis nigricans]